MKPRTIIGTIFVVASLLKLACMWGLINWPLLGRVPADPVETYTGTLLMLAIGIYLIYESHATHSEGWDERIVKTRTIIGGIFVIGSLLKLASLWGIVHIGWLEGMAGGAFETYLAVCLLLIIGIAFIYTGLKPKAKE